MTSAPNAQIKNQTKRLSTRFSFLLGILIAALIILLVGSAILLGQRYLAEQTSNTLSLLSNAYSQNIVTKIHAGESFLASQSTNPAILSALRGEDSPDQLSLAASYFQEELNGQISSETGLKEIFAANQTGTVLLSSQEKWLNAQLPDEWINRFAASKATFAASPSASSSQEPLQEDPIQIFSVVPFPYTAPQPEYWLIGIYEPQSLLLSVQPQNKFTTHVFWIADEQIWFSANDNSEIVRHEPAPAQLESYQRILPTITKNGNPTFKHTPFGTSVNYTKIEELGLILAVETNPAQIFLPWLRTQPELLPVLAGLLLIILLLLLTPQFALRPLRRLALDATQFTHGNWEQKASSQQDNELGVIARSFNQLANEVQQLARRLDSQTSDHNDKIHGLEKLSKLALLSPNMEELVRPILVLTLKHFGYQYAALYLLSREPDGNYAAILRQGVGDIEIERTFIQKRIVLNPINEAETVIAKVFSSKQPAYAYKENTSDFNQSNADIFHEIAIPITINEKVIGCLHIGANAPRKMMMNSYGNSSSAVTQPRGVVWAGTNLPTTPRVSFFTDIKVAELQTVANQISLALRSFHSEGRMSSVSNLSENTQTSLIYQAGAQIAQSENLEDLFTKTSSILQEIPHSSALLLGEGDELQIIQRWPGKNEHAGRIIRQLPGKNCLPVSLRAISSYFKSSTPIILNDLRSASLPQVLMDVPRQMGCDSVAYLPVMRNNRIACILILGHSKEPKDSLSKKLYAPGAFNPDYLQPYNYLIETIAATIEKLKAQEDIHKRLAEVQTLWNISQAISVENDLQALYQVIHNQAEKVMGKLSSFAVLLYDERSGMIHAPYIVEEGKNLEINAFPLGEGLTSVVMRSGKPLLISENMEKSIREMGAKTVGALAKSWLGVPLIYRGETFGVIIAQDIFHENRFSDTDLRLLSTIASQVALVIRNVRLLETSKTQARIERILNQITGKIRRSMDMESILQTTADELAYALNARKANIKIEIAQTTNKKERSTSELVDPSNPNTTEELERQR